MEFLGDDVQSLVEEFEKTKTALDTAHRELQRRVAEAEFVNQELKRSQETLKRKNRELERFNKTMIDREIRMIELKKRIAELEEQVAAHNGEAGLARTPE